MCVCVCVCVCACVRVCKRKGNPTRDSQDSGLINDDTAARGGALYGLSLALTHDHDAKVMVPALLTEHVAALQATHLLDRNRGE